MHRHCERSETIRELHPLPLGRRSRQGGLAMTEICIGTFRGTHYGARVAEGLGIKTGEIAGKAA